MKKIAENYAANLKQSRSSGRTWAGDLCLARVADDLRHCYADVTASEQPRKLLALAQAVDALMPRSADNSA